MDFIIRESRIEDGEEKGYVHYHAWIETYTGLIPQEFLDSRSLDKCIELAKLYHRDTLVALVDGKVIGFAGYLEDSRDLTSIKPSSEIVALYVLKAYQHRGIGYALMQESLNRVTKENVILFVLEGNELAIKFYEKVGFRFTGHVIRKPILGGVLVELEMVLNR